MLGALEDVVGPLGILEFWAQHNFLVVLGLGMRMYLEALTPKPQALKPFKVPARMLIPEVE